MPTVKGYRQAGEMSGSVELGEKKVISKYSLEYVVIADNTSQGVITIRSTSGLPIVGLSTYSYNGENDAFAVCKRKNPRRDPKNPLVWYVRCEFDDDPNSQAESNEQDQEPAVDRSPIVNWSSEYGEESLEIDYSDPPKEIVTPVGNPFDPPPTRRVIYPVVQIERFQATYTPAVQLAFVDHTNKDPFMGAAAGHALMAEIAAGQVVEDGVKLWRVIYRIRFSVKGYVAKPINQDHKYLESPGSTTLKSEPGNTLVNLNLDGTKAEYGTRTFGGADGLGFKLYPEADFDSLGLA
jgi:hypothetical protein